eukprot:TRINITY_DN10349_c3_g1_i3.p1 TRINITY_DN10349_c3_g1~~TRINITY_DN10349_c3_g1_i3.p1  ORF type:complete len:313 (-),score=2.63 TRINITY_DN10349_c3_g1_i3:931-1743(-)
MKHTLSQIDHTAIGAACGITEITLMQPTVAFKNALQEGRSIPLNPIQWYRGYMMNLVSITPTIAMQFSANYLYEKLYRGFYGKAPTELGTIMIAACAGATSAVVIGPTELVVIQQQRHFRNLSIMLPHLWKNYGASWMMRGIDATVCREAIYCGGYLGLAPVLKQYLDQFEGISNSNKILFSGIAGGLFAALFSQPFDTIKTIMQAQLDVKLKPEYRTMMTTGYYVAGQRGIPYLWKGLLPRGLRLICASIIINATRSFIIDLFESEDNS